MIKDRKQLEAQHAKQYPDRKLPMNITQRKVDNNEGYVVAKQGYGNSKAFMSMKYSMDEKLQMAKEHLATLTERKPKEPRPFPKYIRVNNGNQDQLLIEIKKKKKVVFWKSFLTGSREEQLQAAEECLASLRADGLIK